FTKLDLCRRHCWSRGRIVGAGGHNPKFCAPLVRIASVDDGDSRARDPASVDKIWLQSGGPGFGFAAFRQPASECFSAVENDYAARLRFVLELDCKIVQPRVFVITIYVSK